MTNLAANLWAVSNYNLLIRVLQKGRKHQYSSQNVVVPDIYRDKKRWLIQHVKEMIHEPFCTAEIWEFHLRLFAIVTPRKTVESTMKTIVENKIIWKDGWVCFWENIINCFFTIDRQPRLNDSRGNNINIRLACYYQSATMHSVSLTFTQNQVRPNIPQTYCPQQPHALINS